MATIETIETESCIRKVSWLFLEKCCVFFKQAHERQLRRWFKFFKACLKVIRTCLKPSLKQIYFSKQNSNRESELKSKNFKCYNS